MPLKLRTLQNGGTCGASLVRIEDALRLAQDRLQIDDLSCLSRATGAHPAGEQREGRCRWIGFSTHATTDLILRAIESGGFDYVNLHWYFVNDLNWPAIQTAHARDMGVFIISPNDKGGQLWNLPELVKGIVAPLTNGVTMIVDEADLDVDRWYEILEREQVDVWYTAPTAIRMLMKVGADAAKGCDLSRLRHLCSVGEPLNPEGVVWGLEAFGLPFHDNWWQTETGGIMIANYVSQDIRPGSMGRPLPGVEVRLLDGSGTPAAVR